MSTPDSPAWKAKLKQKKKQQERRVIRHSEPTCHDSGLRRSATVSTRGSAVSKAKRAGQKPNDDGQHSSGDEVFAALVARQAQVRKEVAIRRRRRFVAPVRSISKGGQVQRSEGGETDAGNNHMSHQDCAAEIISEMADAMRPQSGLRRQPLGSKQDLIDQNWSALVQQAKAAAAHQSAIDGVSDASFQPSRRPKGSRPWSSPQRYSNFAAELPVSPWEVLVQQHRQRAEAEEEAAKSIIDEQEESAPETEHSSDTLESDDDRPSAPAWERPSSKQMPAAPPVPPHLLQFHEFQKELAAMEKEREFQRGLQRERSYTERPNQSRKHEQPNSHKQERTGQEQKKSSKSHMQQSADVRKTKKKNPASASETNCPDTHCEPSSWAWSPWRCLFFPRRHSGEANLPSQGDSCSRGHSRSRAKVAPECDSNLGEDESASNEVFVETPAQEPRNKFIVEIDELMDRARGLPLQDRRKTFRELQRRIHPDKNLADQDAAKLAFQYLMENRNFFMKG